MKNNKRTATPFAYKVEKDGEMLLDFLLSVMLNKKRGDVKSALSHGAVFVNNRPITQFDSPLKAGDVVHVYRGPVRQSELLQNVPIEILYEDDSILAINKQHNLLTVASEAESERTAYRLMNAYMRQRDPDSRVFVVHRLDKETSGVLLVAKSQEVQKILQENWNALVLHRGYMAVVEGVISPAEGTIRTFVKETSSHRVYSSGKEGDGKEAVTHYKTRSANSQYSLLEIRLETGRKNQIRAHMSEQGCPVAGDKKYGAENNPIKRLALHAHVFEFTHPVTREKLTIEAPMPMGFKLGNLKKKAKAKARARAKA